MGVDYRLILERKKGRQSQVVEDLSEAKKKVDDLFLQTVYCEEAQTIIQNIAQLTQEQLQYHISELVTLAMAAVFDDPYELQVEFALKRNRTECDLWFVRNGKKISPLSASGGGAVDVASFALRVTLWSLANPSTHNTLVLDEPLHFLKGDELPEKGAAMIKELSSRIGLQVIMISHIPDQIEGADRVHKVRMVNGVSHYKRG